MIKEGTDWVCGFSGPLLPGAQQPPESGPEAGLCTAALPSALSRVCVQKEGLSEGMNEPACHVPAPWPPTLAPTGEAWVL